MDGRGTRPEYAYPVFDEVREDDAAVVEREMLPGDRGLADFFFQIP
jgi:hypothetical protein